MSQTTQTAAPLRIGWSRQETTPVGPVLLAGQFYCRVSEGVDDPLSATALAIDNGQDHVVLVGADILSIPHTVQEEIRRKLAGTPGLDPARVIMSATHTHTAPDLRLDKTGALGGFGEPGVDLGIDGSSIAAYCDLFTTQVAVAVRQAWERRAPGSLAYGLTHAVIGRNRRWVGRDGVSTMYGDTTRPDFGHIEGIEDPSVNILAAWDASGRLSGVVMNVPCPSQLSEHQFRVSADYWHETRTLIRQRHGEGVHVLPQCSVAGDQSPRPIWGRQAEARMLRLKGRTERQELAHRLANALDDVLPHIRPTAQERMVVGHAVETIELPLNRLTQRDVDEALAEAEVMSGKYEAEKARLDADPSVRREARWYQSVTASYRRATWLRRVAERFALQSERRTESANVHVVRLGEMVMATNPYEYYLDYGIRIKARSPFEQTFLVQLAGHGTYVPSARSTAGGGYGSTPASNPVGAEGGEMLCEATLAIIQRLRG